MQPLGTQQKPMLLATLAISLATPLAIWMLAPWRPSDWLANRLYAELEQTKDDQIDLPARQLASVGEAGWVALLRGLQSRRPAVRVAAERAIKEEIDSWQRLPTEMSAPRVSLLARRLVKSLSSADAESLHVSGNLAERLLSWPCGGNGVLLVYDCEQVLRAARSAGWPKAYIADPAPNPPRLATRIPDPPAETTAEFASALAVPEESPTAIPAGELDATASTVDDTVEVVPETKPLGLQPVLSFVPSSSELGHLSAAIGLPDEEATPVEPPAHTSPDWPTLEVHQVLRYWRDATFTGAAETELRRRRFDELNLRVARIAADADPENRIKLTRLLPELSGVNATGWLLVLARDESSRVRAAAVQVLSTTTDPQIHQQLQKLEEIETDAGVRTAMRRSRNAVR